MKMIAIATSMAVVAAGGLAGILVGGASAELARDSESLARARPSAATVIMTPPRRAIETGAPITTASPEPVSVTPTIPLAVLHPEPARVAPAPTRILVDSEPARAPSGIQSGIRARAVPEQMLTSNQPAAARAPAPAPTPALRVTTHPAVTATVQHPPAAAQARPNRRGRGTHQPPPATQQATASPAPGTPLPAAGPSPDATHATTMSFADEPPPSSPPAPTTAPQASSLPAVTEQP